MTDLPFLLEYKLVLNSPLKVEQYLVDSQVLFVECILPYCLDHVCEVWNNDLGKLKDSCMLLGFISKEFNWISICKFGTQFHIKKL